MATPEIQAFHNQTRAALNGIALGGMMVDKHRGFRYTHPTFKGLPFNSTGSQNRFAFQNKAENDTPLEDKIAGGARSQTAQKMLQGRLKVRAQNVRDAELMKQGLPPNPPDPRTFELPAAESIKLELDTTLTALNNVLEAGDISSMTIKEFSNLPRLVIRFMAGTSNRSEVAVLVETLQSDIVEVLDEIADPSVRGNQIADADLRLKAKELLGSLVLPLVKMLKSYITFLGRWDGSEKSRERKITDLVRAFGVSKTDLSDVRKLIKTMGEAQAPPGVGVLPGRAQLTREEKRAAILQALDLSRAGFSRSEIRDAISPALFDLLQADAEAQAVFQNEQFGLMAE